MKFQLEHPLTFPELQALNTSLVEHCHATELDSIKILQIVEQRDKLILTHSEKLTGSDKKAFLESELHCNQQIIDNLSEVLKSTEQELTQFVRRQKAVGEYKK